MYTIAAKQARSGMVRRRPPWGGRGGAGSSGSTSAHSSSGTRCRRGLSWHASCQTHPKRSETTSKRTATAVPIPSSAWTVCPERRPVWPWSACQSSVAAARPRTRPEGAGQSGGSKPRRACRPARARHGPLGRPRSWPSLGGHLWHRVESLVVAGGRVAARLVEDDVVGEQGWQRIGVVHGLERSRAPGPCKARGPTTRPPEAPSATAIFHH